MRFAFIVAKMRDSFAFDLYHIAFETKSAPRILTSFLNSRVMSIGSQSDCWEKFQRIIFRKSFFLIPIVHHVQEWMPLEENTPADLYLLIARYALYEPTRESFSIYIYTYINAVKNNSPLRKKERERGEGARIRG